MHQKNIDTKLLKRIQSKEFEEAVDQAVSSFMYDLDYMLLEEQHSGKKNNHSCIQSNSGIKWLNPFWEYAFKKLFIFVTPVI